MLRSIEQKRAKFAWEKITQVKIKFEKGKSIQLKFNSEGKPIEINKTFIENYISYVKKSPTLIMTNGLGTTLAFYKSKSKDAYGYLYDNINEWFIKTRKIEAKDILEWIIDEKTSSVQVYQVTSEIISLLAWMKRFVESELGELVKNKNEEDIDDRGD